MRYKKDYTGIAREYAARALRDKQRKRHGELVQLACRRFLDDLERAQTPGCKFYFSRDHADDPCDFIEKMPHVEGVWDTHNIELEPFQIFFIVNVFGFRNRDTGFRRFTTALFAVARKNAKSTLFAAILVYCLCCEPEPGGQLRTAATTGDQAAIIFKMAKSMIDMQPDLRADYGLESLARTIARPDIGANMSAVNAKASTQDGLNPSVVTLDEIHAHKDPDLLNVLQSAAGARRNPLWLFATTEGFANAGPWADMRFFAIQLLNGVFKNTADHFFALFFRVDKDDYEFDPKIWIKANPLIEANPLLLQAIQRDAVEAKHMSSKINEFKIKRLNRSASVSDGWVDLELFKACGGAVDLDMLADVPCWGGLDLASTNDLSALQLVWLLEGVYYTIGMRWAPTDAIAYRTERGTVPYQGWVDAGLLKQTPGNRTDYSIVADDIRELCLRFNIQGIAYDPYNAGTVIKTLEEEGVTCIPFIQGTKSYHPAMQKFEVAYGQGNIAHGGDPVLLWAASNLIIRTDNGLRMAPDKKRAADKIDPMAALLMAIGVVDDDEDSMAFLNDPIIG